MTLGGPIKRGTTHFFATYEFDDYELGYDFNLSTLLLVPTVPARAGADCELHATATA